jgi:glycosyltransferase involved in cell wall biosynthesis
MHQYTSDYANRMAAAGHDVHLVTTTRYPADRYSPDVTVHTPIATTNTGFSIESLDLVAFRRLQSTVFNLQPATPNPQPSTPNSPPDLVHFTGPHLWNPLLLRSLRRAGIPTVHTIHDLDPHSGTGYGRLLHLWNALILRRADHILVHGERYRDRLLAQGLPSDRVTHLPLLHLFLGHDPQPATFNSQPSTLNSQLPTPDSRFVLFFGRLERYKGIDTLIAAWPILTSNLEPATFSPQPSTRNPSLLLAGPGTPPTSLPPGVDLRNRLIEDDEAIDLFHRCALLVLPYRDATQSAMIGAAYFFGKPVIVTRTGALPEYVVEGETGWVVPPGDPEALAGCLTHALSDPARLVRMGQAGRTWYNRRREAEWEALQTMYHARSRASTIREDEDGDDTEAKRPTIIP